MLVELCTEDCSLGPKMVVQSLGTECCHSQPGVTPTAEKCPPRAGHEERQLTSLAFADVVHLLTSSSAVIRSETLTTGAPPDVSAEGTLYASRHGDAGPLSVTSCLALSADVIPPLTSPR